MNINNKNILLEYVLSLKERSRNEKKKGYFNYGFDWIIYQIFQQKGEIEVRLPFFRTNNFQDFKTKPNEAEFGIDLSFYNAESKILSIIVLKDEALTYANWRECKFDDDLNRASQPDLKGYDINEVKIFLIYNKDDDANGIKCFTDFVDTRNKRISDNIILTFERWNLAKIVQEIDEFAFNPDILPLNLSSQLNYLCSQISDFDFLSDEWNNQLIPNWRSFIKNVFFDKIDKTRINLIKLSLAILKNSQKDKIDKDISWIDLIEWVVLFLWSNFRKQDNIDIKEQIFEFWGDIYLLSLDDYINNNSELFKVQNGISYSGFQLIQLEQINDTLSSFNFIEKLCIQTLGWSYFMTEDMRAKYINASALKLNTFIFLNPASRRPLLDIHHIDLFLIWLIFYLSEKSDFIRDYFTFLENYLFLRRLTIFEIPFLEGRNNLDLVIEYMITKKMPYNFVDNSSYLILMILEICRDINISEGLALSELYFKHIVLNNHDATESNKNWKKILDLQSWVPPDDWDERVFLEQISDGISINFPIINFNKTKAKELDGIIRDFIKNNMDNFPNKIRFDDIPLAVYLLACIKNKSPLPPIFWRKYFTQNI